MGHLIDILGAISSTISASDEFRALIENSLTTSTATAADDGSSGDSTSTQLDVWKKLLQSNEDELQVQTRLLADCDPSENENQDYGRDGLLGFPSIADDAENDTDDYNFNYHSSMQ
jgi:hypothetical protein